jgi:GNAT superfamily N-acetyltransferase
VRSIVSEGMPVPQKSDLLSVHEIGELQDRAARAIPAAVQELRGGCWLRYDDTDTSWWAGATLMHAGDSVDDDLLTGIVGAEQFYAEHGAAARFQVCPACPPDLDDELSRRGYVHRRTVTLQVARTADVAALSASSDLVVGLQDRPDPAWLDVFLAAQEGPGDATSEWQLLQRIDRPSAYVTARLDGEPIAVGRAAADSGWVGVFGMATLPAARRRGAARAVLGTLGRWADDRGCPQMYLQVARHSGPALMLYERAGFQEACSYHYRVATR